MTVRVLRYGGDGTYFLRDGAHELAEFRHGPAAHVLSGGDEPVGLLVDTLARATRTRRRSFDVVVAAPKPVSVLLALEDTSSCSNLVSLHQSAVIAAVDYLRTALRTHAGPSDEIDAVGFTHGVNRLLDPHLHTHVVIGAVSKRGGVVSAPVLTRHARAADGLYLAALRAGSANATARRAWIAGDGTFRVEGVDNGLVAAMSLPRGRDGRVELVGRRPPGSRGDLRAAWRRTAETSPVLGAPRLPRDPGTAIDEHRFCASLGDELIGAPELVAGWSSACTYGQWPAEVLAAVDLLAPTATSRPTYPAILFRAGRAVRALGSRPRDPRELSRWLDAARRLTRAVETDRATTSGPTRDDGGRLRCVGSDR
jgi:TrwC relaxase